MRFSPRSRSRHPKPLSTSHQTGKPVNAKESATESYTHPQLMQIVRTPMTVGRDGAAVCCLLEHGARLAPVLCAGTLCPRLSVAWRSHSATIDVPEQKHQHYAMYQEKLLLFACRQRLASADALMEYRTAIDEMICGSRRAVVGAAARLRIFSQSQNASTRT
jgi:hypothetical protein